MGERLATEKSTIEYTKAFKRGLFIESTFNHDNYDNLKNPQKCACVYSGVFFVVY